MAAKCTRAECCPGAPGSRTAGDMPLRLAPLVALLVALCAAPPAGAQTFSRLYHGATQQGGEVRVTAQPGERQATITVEWRLRCRGLVIRSDGTTLRAPRYATSGREFAVVGIVTDALLEESSPPEGSSVYVEVAVSGLRVTPRGRPGSETWSGVLELETELRDDETGRIVGRCRGKRIRWRAWREGYGTGTWTMTSTAGDYVGAGREWRYGRADAEMTAYGDRETVVFSVIARDGTTWTATFSAPEGRRLARGQRFVDADDDDSVDGGAVVDVIGARSCGGSVGEFTVDAARYDGRGRLRDMTVTFEQRCGAPGEALRGTLAFRSLP